MINPNAGFQTAPSIDTEAKIELATPDIFIIPAPQAPVVFQQAELNPNAPVFKDLTVRDIEIIEGRGGVVTTPININKITEKGAHGRSNAYSLQDLQKILLEMGRKKKDITSRKNAVAALSEVMKQYCEYVKVMNRQTPVICGDLGEVVG